MVKKCYLQKALADDIYKKDNYKIPAYITTFISSLGNECLKSQKVFCHSLNEEMEKQLIALY
jgi:hypothetical protein